MVQWQSSCQCVAHFFLSDRIKAVFPFLPLSFAHSIFSNMHKIPVDSNPQEPVFTSGGASPPAEEPLLDQKLAMTASTQTGTPPVSHRSLSPPKTPPPVDEEELRPKRHVARLVSMGDFEPEQHFYPRVLNAQIHPLVQSFLTLGNERIIARYTHLNPRVQAEKLREILSYSPKYFQWAGMERKFSLFLLSNVYELMNIYRI